MQVLVTGGGGFLGRYVVEQLAARGDSVRVLSRRELPELVSLGVEVVPGDLSDLAAVEAACEGCEAVFHVAAIAGVWGKWEVFERANVLGTRHVLSGCRKHGVRKLIYTSSPSVVYDGQPHENAEESLPYPARYLAHYPHSKAIAERDVLAANQRDGLLTTALRPHLIWGPRDPHLIPRVIARAKAGRLKRVGDGTNRISMSYVENVAAAHLQACDALTAESPVAGQAYFINEPEPVNLWDWIDEILSRAGLPPVRRRVSFRAAYAAGAVLEAVYGLFGVQAEPLMTRFVASQLAQSHFYSVRRAQQDFGYRGLVSVEEGMRRLEPELRRWAGTD